MTLPRRLASSLLGGRLAPGLPSSHTSSIWMRAVSTRRIDEICDHIDDGFICRCTRATAVRPVAGHERDERHHVTGPVTVPIGHRGSYGK